MTIQLLQDVYKAGEDTRGRPPRDSLPSTAAVLRPVTATRRTNKNARATNFKVKIQN